MLEIYFSLGVLNGMLKFRIATENNQTHFLYLDFSGLHRGVQVCIEVRCEGSTRRLGAGDSWIFPKSRCVLEAVTSSLLIRLGCPDTLGLSTGSNSFGSVVFRR